MSIDAIRQGARLVEIPLPLDHDHTGPGWSGTSTPTPPGGRHRLGDRSGPAGTPRLRLAAVVGVAVVAIVASVGLGTATRWHGEALPPPTAKPRVILVTIAGARVDLLDDPRVSAIGELARTSATATVAHADSLTARRPGVSARVARRRCTGGAGGTGGGPRVRRGGWDSSTSPPQPWPGRSRWRRCPTARPRWSTRSRCPATAAATAPGACWATRFEVAGGRVGYVWAGKGRAQLANGAAAVADDGGTIDTVDIAGVGDDPDTAAQRYVDLDADRSLSRPVAALARRRPRPSPTSTVLSRPSLPIGVPPTP